MEPQRRLKESLRLLGYYPADNSEIPDIPNSCLPLITTLVDDLSHSQTRISKLEVELADARKQKREMELQVGNPEKVIEFRWGV